MVNDHSAVTDISGRCNSSCPCLRLVRGLRARLPCLSPGRLNGQPPTTSDRVKGRGTLRDILRRFRLWRSTWVLRLHHLYNNAEAIYSQSVCPHSFRPARINGNPGRFCKICEQSQELELGEFYAQFGERGMAMLSAGLPWQPLPPEIHSDTVA